MHLIKLINVKSTLFKSFMDPNDFYPVTRQAGINLCWASSSYVSCFSKGLQLMIIQPKKMF